MARPKREPATGRTGCPSVAMSRDGAQPVSIQNTVAAAALMTRSRIRPPRSTRTTSGSERVRSFAR